MEDPRWLRLVVIGLVLAAVAVGYFLLSGRFFLNNIAKINPTPSPTVLGQSISPTPAPTFISTPTPAAGSAYDRVVNRVQSGTQTLPRTGSPAVAAAIFSASVIIIGWGLRKFPR